MNPVDHVRTQIHLLLTPFTIRYLTILTCHLSSPTVVVITSISVKHRPSQDTLLKVKRRVLLLPGGLVCYVVRKRSRIELFLRCGSQMQWYRLASRCEDSCKQRDSSLIATKLLFIQRLQHIMMISVQLDSLEISVLFPWSSCIGKYDEEHDLSAEYRG